MTAIQQEKDGRVRLEGAVGVEDAETLMQTLHALRATAEPVVDLGGCEHLHAAALQVLLALRPRLAGMPTDAWMRAALAGLPLEETPQ